MRAAPDTRSWAVLALAVWTERHERSTAETTAITRERRSCCRPNPRDPSAGITKAVVVVEGRDRTQLHDYEDLPKNSIVDPIPLELGSASAPGR